MLKFLTTRTIISALQLDPILSCVQVPRILNPVVLVLEALPDLCKDTRINALVTDSYGGVDECRCCPCPWKVCLHEVAHSNA